MSALVSIDLFGKPGWELEGEENLELRLRELGGMLKYRLERAAGIIEKLRGDGWEISLTLYDVKCLAGGLDDVAAVEKRLEGLGIKSSEVSIEIIGDDDDGPFEDEEDFPEELNL